MGDRGNIVVRGCRGDVYLYSHNQGTVLKDILQNALARRLRWNDASYLARIIFSEMIKEDVNGELGYGISTYIVDNEHGILVVDVPSQCVARIDESNLSGSRLPSTLDYRVSRSFEEYAKHGFKGRRGVRVEHRTGLPSRRGAQPPAYSPLDRREHRERRKA